MLRDTVGFHVFPDERRLLVNSGMTDEELFDALVELWQTTGTKLPPPMVKGDDDKPVLANGWTKGVIW